MRAMKHSRSKRLGQRQNMPAVTGQAQHRCSAGAAKQAFKTNTHLCLLISLLEVAVHIAGSNQGGRICKRQRAMAEQRSAAVWRGAKQLCSGTPIAQHRQAGAMQV